MGEYNNWMIYKHNVCGDTLLNHPNGEVLNTVPDSGWGYCPGCDRWLDIDDHEITKINLFRKIEESKPSKKLEGLEKFM